MAETPSVGNDVQRSEKTRKKLFLELWVPCSNRWATGPDQWWIQA